MTDGLLVRDPLERKGPCLETGIRRNGPGRGGIGRPAPRPLPSGGRHERADRQGCFRFCSFYAGMRILPREKRDAMYDVYGFCRIVDDIADGDACQDDPIGAMNRWRADIDALYDGGDAGQAKFLAPHVARYGLKRADFLSPSSTAWRWTCAVRSWRRTPPRSISIATAWRAPSVVCRYAFRSPRSPASNSPTTSAARCSSPTFCATSTRMRASALYLPREYLLDAGMSDLTPAAVAAHPALPQVCARLLQQARARAFPNRAKHHGRVAAPPSRPAPHGERLRRRARTA